MKDPTKITIKNGLPTGEGGRSVTLDIKEDFNEEAYLMHVRAGMMALYRNLLENLGHKCVKFSPGDTETERTEKLRQVIKCADKYAEMARNLRMVKG